MAGSVMGLGHATNFQVTFVTGMYVCRGTHITTLSRFQRLKAQCPTYYRYGVVELPKHVWLFC